jgi:hypothetical protein
MPDTFPIFMNFRDGAVQGPYCNCKYYLTKDLSANSYRFRQLVAELQCNLLSECGTIFFLVVFAKDSERKVGRLGRGDTHDSRVFNSLPLKLIVANYGVKANGRS